MDEQFEKAVKDCILTILSRFTNGINDLNIEVKKSSRGEEHYHFETENIPMTPQVFKHLHIVGDGYECMERDTSVINWRLRWQGRGFNGGSNGTEFISIKTTTDIRFDDLRVLEIKF